MLHANICANIQHSTACAQVTVVTASRHDQELAQQAAISNMLSCTRVRDSVSDTVYFLLITVHEDKRDLEHRSSFDVEITDGQSAWVKKGHMSVFTSARFRKWYHG